MEYHGNTNQPTIKGISWGVGTNTMKFGCVRKWTCMAMLAGKIVIRHQMGRYPILIWLSSSSSHPAYGSAALQRCGRLEPSKRMGNTGAGQVHATEKEHEETSLNHSIFANITTRWTIEIVNFNQKACNVCVGIFAVRSHRHRWLFTSSDQSPSGKPAAQGNFTF